MLSESQSNTTVDHNCVVLNCFFPLAETAELIVVIANATATCNEQQPEARVPFSLNPVLQATWHLYGHNAKAITPLMQRTSGHWQTCDAHWRRRDPCSCNEVQVQGSHVEPCICILSTHLCLLPTGSFSCSPLRL